MLCCMQRATWEQEVADASAHSQDNQAFEAGGPTHPHFGNSNLEPSVEGAALQNTGFGDAKFEALQKDGTIVASETENLLDTLPFGVGTVQKVWRDAVISSFLFISMQQCCESISKGNVRSIQCNRIPYTCREGSVPWIGGRRRLATKRTPCGAVLQQFFCFYLYAWCFRCLNMVFCAARHCHCRWYSYILVLSTTISSRWMGARLHHANHWGRWRALY